MPSKEDAARLILEFIYRSHRKNDENLSLNEVQRILEISSDDLTEAINTLENKGYIELKNESMILTTNGKLIMDQRELSFCPYL
ncbi:hypothetical protein GF319_11745 [Candidatus Bathyarchaeota archaeon]|nr:hypothetical protein [Candidatus Bathyarchaeota archaeon]